MRPALAIALLALAACRREPSFDERYDDTAKQIEQRAARIDAQLNQANAVEADPPPAQRK